MYCGGWEEVWEGGGRVGCALGPLTGVIARGWDYLAFVFFFAGFSVPKDPGSSVRTSGPKLVEVELLTRLPEEKRRCVTFFDNVYADLEGLCSALSRASLTEAIQGTTCVNTAWDSLGIYCLPNHKTLIPSRTITLHRKKTHPG